MGGGENATQQDYAQDFGMEVTLDSWLLHFLVSSQILLPPLGPGSAVAGGASGPFAGYLHKQE